MRTAAPVTLAVSILLASAWLSAAGGNGAGPRAVQRGSLGSPVQQQRDARSAVAQCNALKGEAIAACVSTAGLNYIRDSPDTPARAILAFANDVYSVGGFAAASCHIAMHEVGRRVGDAERVTLESLQNALPKSNDAGCPAGFAHGLLTSIGPQLAKLSPSELRRACAASPTRYQQYSCEHGLGHAFSRLSGDQVGSALEACKILGAHAPDCAQGVFHDYWFALAGVDGASGAGLQTLSARGLCRMVEREFVRACWYRSFMEQPDKPVIRQSRDLVRLCGDLAGLQRAGCIAGANVVASDDPFDQMRGCASLTSEDALACVRGVAVQSIDASDEAAQQELILECTRFPQGAQFECMRWIARLVAVITDGRYASGRCVGTPAQKAACRLGLCETDKPLETFS